MKSIFLSYVACLCSAGAIMAQTTLSGDHIITGDLDVGATGALGGLKVNGETGNAASPGIKVTGDGGVLFEGAFDTGHIPATGSGTRFMWYPKKAALRVGAASGTNWDDDNIGSWSTAFGLDSTASGSKSFAVGSGYASGDKDIALAGVVLNSGSAVAMSSGMVQYASQSTAMSSGLASFGSYQTAMSGGDTTSEYATAMSGGTALAHKSVAMSEGMSVGQYSTAMSKGNASTDYSVAAGQNVFVYSYSSIGFGRNVSIDGDAENWVETDPLFVIGNGTGNPSDPPDVEYRNAFTVYKNGNVELTAKVKMPRQGDILMGEFGSPE